jgi:hypothetical protein
MLRADGWVLASDPPIRAMPFDGRYLLDLADGWAATATIRLVKADPDEPRLHRGTKWFIGIECGVTYPQAERLLASLGVATANLTVATVPAFAGDAEPGWIDLPDREDCPEASRRILQYVNEIATERVTRSVGRLHAGRTKHLPR